MSDASIEDVVAFLEAYFHQDWREDTSRWEDVADAFAVEAATERRALARSIREQASAAGVEEICRMMRDRVRQLPSTDGRLEDWLIEVADRLEAPDRRARVVSEYADLLHRLDEDVTSAAEIEPRRQQLRDEYASTLPVVGVARSPFSGASVRLHIDVGGLDGPWWDFHAPVRPIEDVDPTFVEMTGALPLPSDVPNLPTLIVPGPEAPYVLPGMLRDPSVAAVVSRVEIEGAPGCAITYFSSAPIAEAPPAWGCEEPTPRQGQTPRVAATFASLDEFDFDLEPWITSGRLQWIYPGDVTLSLRSDLDSCPFLEVPGDRGVALIQDGAVRRRRTGA